MSAHDRTERLRAGLRQQQLDGLMVTTPENRRYLTGFTGHDGGTDSAGTLLVGLGDATLITDGRYTEQAAHECPGVRVVKREGALQPVLVEAARALGLRRVGFEATHLTVALRDDLAAAAAEAALPLDLVATRGVVEALRVIKDAEELAAIERAVAITDEVFGFLLTYLRPGLTERQVAQEIERQMLARGAEGPAFDSIVASGPNSALPHAIPSDRKLARGESITIDMGAAYAGYCSDMTRTVCLGRAPADLRAMYADVLRAHDVCAAGLRPGVNGQQADALARDALQAAGRGDQFVHGVGHGLGLEIHEDPRLGRLGEKHVLAANMVVTVEPGAYLAGWGGVRVEDTVLITSDGARALSQSPRELEITGRPRAPAAKPARTATRQAGRVAAS
ncbi:MAG TPA: Xaa-Pro peptidase family protein [Ktedonobacterales bacterium]